MRRALNVLFNSGMLRELFACEQGWGRQVGEQECMARSTEDSERKWGEDGEEDTREDGEEDPDHYPDPDSDPDPDPLTLTLTLTLHLT
jgi:hypothetical protein